GLRVIRAGARRGVCWRLGAFEDEVFEKIIARVDVTRVASHGARRLRVGAPSALDEKRVVGGVGVAAREAGIEPAAVRVVHGQQWKAVAAAALGVVDVRLGEIPPVRREPRVERGDFETEPARAALQRFESQYAAAHLMAAIRKAEKII